MNCNTVVHGLDFLILFIDVKQATKRRKLITFKLAKAVILQVKILLEI